MTDLTSTSSRLLNGSGGPAGARERRRARALGGLVPALGLAAYVLLVVLVGARHQPWFDEAQAWLIARDNGLFDLAARGVRYEGSPALWHLVLWLAMRLGLPFGGFWLISASLGIVGAAFVLFRSPFPTAIRILIVFSYFFAYQYAVVARSYALDLALIPVVATLFAERRRRPLVYFCVLALAANTNAHSFVVAGVLATEGAWTLRTDLARGRRRACLAVVLFGAAALAAAAQAYPPADINFVIKRPGEGPLHSFLHALQLFTEAFVERWDIFSQKPPSDASRIIGGALTLLLLIPPLLLFRRAGRLLLAAALFIGLFAFSALKYGNAWHAGIIFLSFVFCLWISWEARGRLGSLQRRALTATLCATLLVGDWYALAAARRDLQETYSPAKFIARVLPGDGHGGVAGRVGVSGFKAFAVQAYFSRNIFSNYEAGRARPAYYLWSRNERPIPGVSEAEWRKTASQGYDYLLLSAFNLMGRNGPYRFSRDARLAGYCLRAAYPGELVWKTYVLESDDMVVYARCPEGFRRSRSEILAPEGGVLDAVPSAVGDPAGLRGPETRPGERAK